MRGMGLYEVTVSIPRTTVQNRRHFFLARNESHARQLGKATIVGALAAEAVVKIVGYRQDRSVAIVAAVRRLQPA